MLLVSFVGAGVQLFGMAVVTIVVAMLGMLSPSSRGSLLTASFLLFVLMGWVSPPPLLRLRWSRAQVRVSPTWDPKQDCVFFCCTWPARGPVQSIFHSPAAAFPLHFAEKLLYCAAKYAFYTNFACSCTFAIVVLGGYFHLNCCASFRSVLSWYYFAIQDPLQKSTFRSPERKYCAGVLPPSWVPRTKDTSSIQVS